jgi:hypothetical protein
MVNTAGMASGLIPNGCPKHRLTCYQSLSNLAYILGRERSHRGFSNDEYVSMLRANSDRENNLTNSVSRTRQALAHPDCWLRRPPYRMEGLAMKPRRCSSTSNPKVRPPAVQL